jgi:DMSO/TMAO reductase YedYZ molybdopterin-dependent catalytic subunit
MIGGRIGPTGRLTVSAAGEDSETSSLEAAMTEQREIPRRTVLRTGAAAGAAGLTTMTMTGPARAFPGAADDVVPWLDQPPPIPEPARNVVGHPLVWEELDSRLTPNAEFFTVKHYDEPALSATGYRLDVTGLVDRPARHSLRELRSRPRRTVEYTLECSGNTGPPFFIGGIGNARWTGTPLHAVLRQARPAADGTEVVFWGADRGPVTIRDNSGVISGGVTGTVQTDADGNLDLTITEQFARSMSLAEAMAPDNLLCFEMNGETLPREHGHPVRLIAPGWYGVANVKWLTRIEVTGQRFAGRFMARDYVTIREQQRDGQTMWTFHTVSHARLKSAPAKVTRRGDRYTVVGVAWGAPISRVEVRIDGGRWQAANLDRSRDRDGFAWRFWHVDWGTPGAGEHTVASRAFDVEGNVQPPPDDPYLAGRRTYWENNGQITRRVLIP